MSPLSVLLAAVLVATASAAICPGCPYEGDASDPVAQNLLKKAVATKNAASNDEDIKIVSVDEVTKQVVSGTKYTIKFTGEGVKTKKRHSCHVELISQPWISREPQVDVYQCT